MRDKAGAQNRLLSHWRRGAQDSTIEREENGAWQPFSLQDRLNWLDDECFVPHGRIDQAVQVGGVNVFPAYVAEVLAMYPDVCAGAVRPMRLDEGKRLKALVVAAASAKPAALREELTTWMAERMLPAERPAAYSFGLALPRQPGGKPADWVIDAWG